MRGVLGIGLAVVLTASGCGGSSSTKTVTVTVTSGGSPTSTSSGSITTRSTSSASAAPNKLTAAQLISALKCAGLPITQTQIYTAASDGNHLLGRPGEYTSKGNWVDGRVPNPSGDFDPSDGGSVEVFTNHADAQKRASYLKALGGGGLIGTNEYDYILNDGETLLRVSNTLTPTQGAVYKATANTIISNPSSADHNCKSGTQVANVKPRPPTSSPYVAGNFTGPIPAGEKGKASVVEYGVLDPDIGEIPVIIRDMSGDAVDIQGVHAVITSSAGVVSTSGLSIIAPTVIKPGQIALGYVSMQTTKFPRPGTHIHFTVSATPVVSSNTSGKDLLVLSAKHVGQAVTGYVKNANAGSVSAGRPGDDARLAGQGGPGRAAGEQQAEDQQNGGGALHHRGYRRSGGSGRYSSG